MAAPAPPHDKNGCLTKKKKKSPNSIAKSVEFLKQRSNKISSVNQKWPHVTTVAQLL